MILLVLIAVNLLNVSGENASVLHYGHAGEPNTRQIKDGDMWLVLSRRIFSTCIFLGITVATLTYLK